MNFRTWLEFARACFSDVEMYTRVCAMMGIDSEQPIKLLVWWGLVYEYLFRRARRDLGNINSRHEELDEFQSVVEMCAHVFV